MYHVEDLELLKDMRDRLQKLLMQPPPELTAQELNRLREAQHLPGVMIEVQEWLIPYKKQEEETRTKVGETRADNSQLS